MQHNGQNYSDEEWLEMTRGAQMEQSTGYNPTEPMSSSNAPYFLRSGLRDMERQREREQNFTQLGTEQRDRYQPSIAAANARMGPQIGGLTFDTTQADQARAQQLALGQQLAARASGQAPSAAEMQMGQALQQSQAQAQSMAMSNPNISPALAQKLAMQQQAMASQGIAGQTAQLRAQEQAQAESALGGLLGGMRQQDMGVAAQQAGLDRATALANQASTLQARGQNDAMTQFYEGLGFQGDQSNRAAQQGYQQHLVQQDQFAKQLEQQAKDRAQRERGAIIGAAGSLVGAGIGAIAGG